MLQTSKSFALMPDCPNASILIGFVATAQVSMYMQTIALASTQFLQPLWDLAIAQPSALTAEHSTDQVDQAKSPDKIPLAAASAQTPTKAALLRAASPLLEEMLESPFTASKPAEPAIDTHCMPGRHALYQDVLEDSSSCQQDLLSCQPSEDTHQCNYATSITSTQGNVSTAEDSTQALSGNLDQQALPPGSLQCNADATGLAPVISASAGSDSCHDDSGAMTQEATEAAADIPRQQIQAAAAQGSDEAAAQTAAQGSAGADVSAQITSTSLTCQPANAESFGTGQVTATPSESHQGRAELDVAQQPQGKYFCYKCQICLRLLQRVHVQEAAWLHWNCALHIGPKAFAALQCRLADEIGSSCFCRQCRRFAKSS